MHKLLPMRVLIINTSERIGGAAIAASRLMESLKNNGIKAKMLVRDKQTDQISVVRLKSNWLQVWKFMWERIVIWSANRFRRYHLFDVDIANTGTDITSLPEFRQADVIHLHWVNQGMLSLKDIRKILTSGKPVVWTMHDMWPCTGICHYARECKNYQQECHDCPYIYKGGGRKDLSYRTFRKKQKLYSYAPIHFVTCSHWLKEQAQTSALFEGKSVTNIPNAINTNLFKPRNKQEARKKCGLPEDMIWYDEVAEYTPAGKTVEKYNYQYNQGGSGFVSEFWQMLYHKPYIIDRKVYKGNNVQEHTEYEYYEDELSYIMGISVRSNLYCPSSEPDIPIHLNKICHDKEIAGIFSPTVNGNMISGDTDSNPDFTIDNYAIHTGLFRLGRKTTRLYDDEAVPYEISEEYLYSDNLLYNMTGTLSCTSLGDSIYTRYYYPSDGYPGYPQTICDLLSQRNLSTTVIATEQTKISGSKQSLISGKKVIYDSIPGDYTRMYPVKTYYKNKLQPDFLQENQRTYYPFGKLATETGRNGVSTVYLWTKDNGSYPVAKIVNASLAEVTAITGNPENIYKNGLYLDIETRLRNELPHAQITTINAAPLIGVQKTTDPNGITTLYVYNSDNLLQEIIWQGAVIKRYEYNYRNR